jgi:hypothetical protein
VPSASADGERDRVLVTAPALSASSVARMSRKLVLFGVRFVHALARLTLAAAHLEAAARALERPVPPLHHRTAAEADLGGGRAHPPTVPRPEDGYVDPFLAPLPPRTAELPFSVAAAVLPGERRVPESNRCTGFCRPVPNHSANAPDSQEGSVPLAVPEPDRRSRPATYDLTDAAHRVEETKWGDDPQDPR